MAGAESRPYQCDQKLSIEILEIPSGLSGLLHEKREMVKGRRVKGEFARNESCFGVS
jgi:hypothetical protein